MKLPALIVTSWFLLVGSAARADKPTAEIAGADAAPGVKYSGTTVVHVIRWTDRRGANVAVLSRTMKDKAGTAMLFVDHYAAAAGKQPKKLRTVREVTTRKCLGDMSAEGDLANLSIAEFVPATLGVTDDDDDGVGELMVGYRAGCAFDDTIAGKVIVLEGGAKHALRGTLAVGTSAALSLGTADGDLTAPDALVAAAKAAWSHLADPL